ncbi:MAG: helix-turn-helix domain-containing protein [Clostridiaceae bacterium]
MSFEVITKAQDDMITMLIIGENITDIAKKLSVTRNTIYSWMSRDNIKAEMDRRKQELAHQGNRYILKDLLTYIDNVKELANDKSDKRVCLAANQYLINRIYGNPSSMVEVSNVDTDNSNMSESELEQEINKFKQLKLVK